MKRAQIGLYARLNFDISFSTLVWAAFGPPATDTAVSHAEAAIADYFGPRTTVIGLSVRTLFDAILAELIEPIGAPILMSAINIESMTQIATAHKRRTFAVDLDPQTLSPHPGSVVAAVENTGAKLFVTAQLYGSVNKIQDACDLRERGVLILEDSAQAFAGPHHLGDINADVSLFSFGPIKRRTALGGAVAVFRNNDLAERVRQRLKTYPVLSEAWHRQRALKYLALKVASSPIVLAGLFHLFKLFGADWDRIIGSSSRGFSHGDLLEAIKRQPPKQLSVLLAKQIIEASNPVHRQNVSSAFLSRLPKDCLVAQFAENHAHWLMPILVDQPDPFIERLQHFGFDATRGATSLRALDSNQTPIAQSILDRVVYLPHPAEMDEKGRQRLLQAVLSLLSPKT
jgi:perosamine synthetase